MARQAATSSGRKHVGCGCGEADLQRAGLAERDTAGDLRGAFSKLQDAPRFRQEAAPGRRQAHRAAGTLQQRRIDDVLEHLDLPGQRRLGHVQPRGGAAEMQFLRHRDETAELVEVEHRYMP
ncbi:hypothetical protein ACVWZK_004286 [Bradyrhizobium sp. GM0.4]